MRRACARPARELALTRPRRRNRALPADIRVLSWRLAPERFSARFTCTWRQYKYFFWQDGGLDTAAMAAAAQLLVGTHDFRNVCKMDVDCVSNFVRTIISFTVQPEEEGAAEGGGGGGPGPGPGPGSGARLWSLNVRGSAFLWHQVRCMAALLLLVGRRHEPPAVVDQLLDVAALPGKPAYDMAAEEPLLFYGCGYPPGCLPAEAAHTPRRSLELLRAHLGAQARRAAVRARVYSAALRAAEEACGGAGELEQARHVPLMARRREASYEVQLARRPPGKVKLRSRGEGDE